jgi:O-antigen/teichoic acid export membrane protein
MGLFKNNKFTLDIFFSYLSLALLALSGIFANVIIAKFYGSVVLGDFNIIYAFYIIISQFSALGIHYSVLRNISVTENISLDKMRQILTSGMILVFFSGVLFCCLTRFICPLINYFYDNVFVLGGIIKFSYVLPLFAMNKVMIAALNGLRRMRLFSLVQACRYLLILFYISLVSALKFDSSYLMNVFYFSEQAVFLILIFLTFFIILRKKFCFSKYWFVEHFKFGLNAFLSGVFIEINSRIDVLILAIFVNSSLVGAYSFSAMVAEGLALLLVTLKNNVNPIFSNLLYNKNYEQLYEFMSLVRKYTYLIMSIVVGLVYFIYVNIINHFLNDQILLNSSIVLLIISGFLFSVSGYLPFSDFLILANKPRLQSIQNILVFISNILLSFLLIPPFGIIGAAISVGFSSYILSVILIVGFAKKEGLSFFQLRKFNLAI